MKDACAVVWRVRGIGPCSMCKGANWRRKAIRFVVERHEVPPLGYSVLRPHKYSVRDSVLGVCRDHLRDAVLEVWK